MVVAWNMAEKREFAVLLRNWQTAAVLVSTFGLTIVEDLTYGIVAGCLMAAMLAVLHCSISSEGGPSITNSALWRARSRDQRAIRPVEIRTGLRGRQSLRVSEHLTGLLARHRDQRQIGSIRSADRKCCGRRHGD